MGSDPSHGVLRASFSSLPPHASHSFSSQLKSRVSGHCGPAWMGQVHTVCYPGASPSPLICWSQASNKSFLERAFVTESLENAALSSSKSSASSPFNAGRSQRWPSGRLSGISMSLLGKREWEREPTDVGGSVPDSLAQFHTTATVSTAEQTRIHRAGLKEQTVEGNAI